MARKVGQIIARGDRRWLIRVYLGRDHETKKRNYHHRTIRGSMREAQAYLTEKLRERDLGRDLEGAKITLNEYLDRWLETAVKPRVRQKTYQDYEGIPGKNIRPALGDRVLVSMLPMDIETSYHGMIERGLSPRTVRYTHAVLRSALRQALQWRLLLENPVDGVKIPQQLRGEMRSLTVEQAQAFLRAALATPHGPVLAVALTTGMRPSEYLALKWHDLDWTRQTVSVVRSVRRLDGRWCFSDTQRSRSRRPIRLQSWIVALLRDLQTKASAHDLYPEAHGLIFRTASGEPINADYLAKHFRSILNLAGVPRMRLYDLRHSAATIALAAGVSPKVVSEQLGHASTAFTLDTYAHVLPHMQDDAAARVEVCSFDRQRDESIRIKSSAPDKNGEFGCRDLFRSRRFHGITFYIFRIADHPFGIPSTENHFFHRLVGANVLPKKSLLFHVGRRSCCATSYPKRKIIPAAFAPAS